MKRLIPVLAATVAIAAAPAAEAAPATLSLELGAPPSFGTLTPGVARDYTASTTAVVSSTAGEATLTVHDGTGVAVGHLVNGSFSLAQPLQAAATSPLATGGPFGPVGGTVSPLTLLTYDAPAANDGVTISFKQSIGATEPLRTGTYSKQLTFTLSTTTPCTMATTATVTVSGGGIAGGTTAPSSGTVSCPGFELSGFFAPIDRTQTNIAKAGRTVPMKWRVTDADGAPVGDPAHFESVTSVGNTCESGATDAIEHYAGGSGLQYLGDGYWQFNWKTPIGYAGQCRTLVLTLSDGATLKADFQFK